MPGPDPRSGDGISLTGVRARGYHGVLDAERREGQDFLVDVHLGLDLGPAAASDDLRRTVDYAEVAALVVQVVEGEPFDLIERVAGVIADRVLGAQPLVERVAVTVHKPQAPVGVPFGDVAVTVHRRRDVPVVIALGANLQDPAGAVRRAARRLHGVRGLRGVRVSPLYRSSPVGGPEQPDYVNAVALARTSLLPGSLLARLQAVEADFGRTHEVRWGPRTLDLDLIQYGDPAAGSDVLSADPELTLPHPRAHERGFVLLPWSTLDPGAVLRIEGVPHPVADLLGTVQITGVQVLEDNR